MRAGRGIAHSERTAPALKRSGQLLFGLQTWVALPEALNESDHAFPHRPPLAKGSETLYADIALGDAGCSEIEAGYDERAVDVLAGRIVIGADVHGAGHTPGAAPGRARAHQRPLNDAGVMLFGGEPMEGPRYVWWNSVSSRPERIEQAQQAWACGLRDSVPGDEAAFIPLPARQHRPRRAVDGRDFR